MNTPWIEGAASTCRDFSCGRSNERDRWCIVCGMTKNTLGGVLIVSLLVSSFVLDTACSPGGPDGALIAEAQALRAELQRLRAAELAARQECETRDEARSAEMNRLMAMLADLKQEQERIKEQRDAIMAAQAALQADLDPGARGGTGARR
ncbi:hypothetical protein [Nannocystis pusilla]|uniref:hypothetical protein n=1 Tax=Nannocystis pusilla TaxID=889268 RepID=UPI003B7D3771